MQDKAMSRLQKISELIERDNLIKTEQQKLNEDIGKFISEELGLTGPATLLDISKRILETSIEPSRIIAP